MLGTVKFLYDPAKELQDANIALVLMIWCMSSQQM